MINKIYSFVQFDTQEEMAQYIYDKIEDESLETIRDKGTREEIFKQRKRYDVNFRIDKDDDENIYSKMKPFVIVESSYHSVKEPEPKEKLLIRSRKLIDYADWREIPLYPKPYKGTEDELYEWRKLRRYRYTLYHRERNRIDYQKKKQQRLEQENKSID